MCQRHSNEAGVALVAALMTIVLMTTLGAALILITSAETMIAANFRAGEQAFYAADAIVERALTDLRVLPEWTDVLNATVRSSFTDGPPSGQRALSDGTAIDLSEIANLANCANANGCTDAELTSSNGERPWGVNNPRWTLFAYGALADLGGTVQSPCYGVALVGDDPSETDGDPTHDGGMGDDPPNPGSSIVIVRGQAFCARRAARTVEAVIGRLPGADPDTPGTDLRVLAWRQLQ